MRLPLRFVLPLLMLLPLAVPEARAADPAADEVLGDMKRVADWQIANPSKHGVTDWTHGPYLLGLLNLHQVSGTRRCLEILEDIGRRAAWGPGPRVTHADDHAVLQAWLEVYRLDVCALTEERRLEEERDR